ncbi:hypothetical protein BCCGELA001_21250 [Bradyrhizobium sp. CCGE-LA001]|nr:hypothetical protein BCCGELA001_21250 [Bradyrhizobium sp. CCGE-LA001]
MRKLRWQQHSFSVRSPRRRHKALAELAAEAPEERVVQGQEQEQALEPVEAPAAAPQAALEEPEVAVTHPRPRLVREPRAARVQPILVQR